MSVPIVLAIGGVAVVLILVWGPIRAKMRLEDLKASCAATRAQLTVLRTQGGSVDEQAKLEAQLATCQQALRDAGIPVDETGEAMASILEIRTQMRGEWLHYKSTDWSDLVKRGNTRGTMWRLGEELAGRYGAMISLIPSDDLDALKGVLSEVLVDINDSKARQLCWRLGQAGCGENPGDMRSERDRVTVPLSAAEERIREAMRQATLARVTPEQRAARDARLAKQDDAKAELGDIFRGIREYRKNR